MVGVFLDEWPELEPTLLEFVGILADGMSAAAPVISNLAQSILPSLISTLGTLFDAAGPVLSIIGDLAQEILPPLAGIISELAANALPPLRDSATLNGKLFDGAGIFVKFHRHILRTPV